MANLYHLPELPPSGPASLTGDIAHHLLRVLRIRVGDEIRIGDGRGGLATATVTSTEKRVLSLQVGPSERRAPLTPAVTLAFAVPRPSRADWLFEHATEVGVHRFQPLWTGRSRPQGIRADRYRKVCAAAAGQCARAWLPEVCEPLELAAYLEAELPQSRILADASGAAISQAADGEDTVLLIGPEGGFQADERALATARGFVATRFAGPILRTETAALVGAAILLRDAR